MVLTSLTWFDFLLIALATARLSMMIANEHGPWHVFDRIRTNLSLGGLTGCVKCISVWAALFFILLYAVAPVVVWIFAASGAALMLRTYTGVGLDV